MTPTKYYQEQIQQGAIHSDPEQLHALKSLQNVYENLIEAYKKQTYLRRILYKPPMIKGVYLWGGVGIGKTFLMDCFYHCLPFKQKKRLHFHQFMQNIHSELKKNQGKIDPLQMIAKEIAKNTLVLCLDELVVSDITDAMLLGRLFKALLEKGVCLVTTSNTEPDNLYKNGLQRSQFLPAIALIKKHTEILHIKSNVDYRLQYLKEAGVFYTPLGKKAEDHMQKTFSLLTENKEIKFEPIQLLGRSIRIKKEAGNIIWFDFKDICSVPRSQHDYLLLAEKYKTVFISDIPVISSDEVDTICLFVNLVDVFYDAKIRLVISAAESVPELYNRGHMLLAYSRTHSRLIQMQSMDYFNNEENNSDTYS